MKDRKYKCHVKGCNSVETLKDVNGVTWICQEHLTQKIFGKKTLSTIISPKEDCPCGSGKKFKNCCTTNPLKMWFIDRIATTVFYYDTKCTIEDCENCENGRKGIKIANLQHAIDLYNFADQNRDNIIFTNDIEKHEKEK